MARAAPKPAALTNKAATPAHSAGKGSGKVEAGPQAKRATKTAPLTPPAKAAKITVEATGRTASKTSAKKGKKAAVPPPPAKPAKAPTVTLKHLAAGIAERRGAPKRDVEAFAAEVTGDMLAQVKEGSRVKIAGLGILEIEDRPARTALNPATGEPVQVVASRKAAFRPARDIEGSV